MELLFNIPDNLKDAIRLFESHINQLQGAYFYLINDYKNDSSQNEIPFYENFEHSLKQAFDVKNSITSSVFISFIEDYFLENDLESLQKAYNIISNKLNSLLIEHKRLKFNPKYYYTKSLYENAPKGLFLFIDSLEFELDENGNYKQPFPDFFTADNLFDKIKNEIKTTSIKIDEIFSLRKLNNKESQTTTQPTAPQKEISRKEQIKWTKKTSLLAYLFYKLEDEKLIIGGTIPANLASIFTDNQYKEIDPKAIQKAITGYKNGVKAQGKTQIDELVELIKKISEKLD